MQLDAAATGDRSRSGARDVPARSGCGSSGAIGLGLAPWCFRGRCDRGPVALRRAAIPIVPQTMDQAWRLGVFVGAATGDRSRSNNLRGVQRFCDIIFWHWVVGRRFRSARCSLNPSPGASGNASQNRASCRCNCNDSTVRRVNSMNQP